MEEIERKLEASLQLLREDNTSMIELLKIRQGNSLTVTDNLLTDDWGNRSGDPSVRLQDTVIKSVESSQQARSRLAKDRCRFDNGITTL